MNFLASLLACISCTQAQSNDEVYAPHESPTTPNTVAPNNILSAEPSKNNAETALVATFSIDRFSKSKFDNEDILNYLYKILSRYDLVVIQEVQNGDEFVQDMVHELSKKSGKSFKYVLGDEVGRKSRKNQILILYRDLYFTLVDSYQYEDLSDAFERPPFVAKFRSTKFSIDEFSVIGVDLYYQAVQSEINEITKVHNEMINKWGDLPTLIMGNFMTGGRHISKTRLEETSLKQDLGYVWLVENIDTTVLKNEYTYDRIIAYGGMEDHYVADSAKEFGFDTEYGLTMDEAKKISDHYPVHIEIAPKSAAERKDASIEEINIQVEDLHITDGEDLFIGSFNIQRFGRKKMNDAFVLSHLYKILGRYDFVLIQELQDSDLKYVGKFMNNLNKATGKKYNYVVSESLGRKTYREQYMYIYREAVFHIVDKFVYDDGSEEEGNDSFAREPFCVLVKSNAQNVDHIAFVGAHINPQKVAEELDEMVNVHNVIVNKWGTGTSVVFMGDFNADGSYLRRKEKEKLKMYQDENYVWLLNDEDTTLAKNDYNYDRIIIYGEDLNKQIIADSAKAYRFDEKFDITLDDAKRISDHYPVEFKISTKKFKDEL